MTGRNKKDDLLFQSILISLEQLECFEEKYNKKEIAFLSVLICAGALSAIYVLYILNELMY